MHGLKLKAPLIKVGNKRWHHLLFIWKICLH